MLGKTMRMLTMVVIACLLVGCDEWETNRDLIELTRLEAKFDTLNANANEATELGSENLAVAFRARRAEVEAELREKAEELLVEAVDLGKEERADRLFALLAQIESDANPNPAQKPGQDRRTEEEPVAVEGPPAEFVIHEVVNATVGRTRIFAEVTTPETDSTRVMEALMAAATWLQEASGRDAVTVRLWRAWPSDPPITRSVDYAPDGCGWTGYECRDAIWDSGWGKDVTTEEMSARLLRECPHVMERPCRWLRAQAEAVAGPVPVPALPPDRLTTDRKRDIFPDRAPTVETSLDMVYRQWMECGLLVGNLSTKVGNAAYDVEATFAGSDEPSNELVRVIGLVSDALDEWGGAILGVSNAMYRMRVELEGGGIVAAYTPTGRGCPAPVFDNGGRGGSSIREVLGLSPITGRVSPATTDLDRAFRQWMECTFADGMFGMQGGSKGAWINQVRESDPGHISREAHAALERLEDLLDELHLANMSLTQMRTKLWEELDKRGIVTPYEPVYSGCPV